DARVSEHRRREDAANGGLRTVGFDPGQAGRVSNRRNHLCRGVRLDGLARRVLRPRRGPGDSRTARAAVPLTGVASGSGEQAVTSNEAPDAGVQSSTLLNILNQLRELVTDALRYWELRRLFYNALLGIIVLGHFMASWPASRTVVTSDGALGLFLLAV